jgi:hypothetical protein
MHLGCDAVRIGAFLRYICPIAVDMVLRQGDSVGRHEQMDRDGLRDVTGLFVEK